MTAKEYLSQARYLDARINTKIKQLEALNTLATSATSVLTGMPHSPNKATSKMADIVDKIVDLQAEINRDIDALVDLKGEMRSKLEMVPAEDYKAILEMPPVSEWLTQTTKNSQQNIAQQVYENTWKWLKDRGCDQYVNKDLIEQYALYMQRTIQCQEGINQYGLLAKHPTTQMPIASPYFNMALQSSKQANLYWMQIYQIVKDNCETPIGNSNPNDDLMERLLG